MEHLANIDLWLALGVVTATALTDAVCVLFTASIIHRKSLAVANWSALSYTLSSFAVISFTSNWIYVVPAALGSWLGAYITMKCLHGPIERVDQVLDEVFAAPPSELVSARHPQPLPLAPLPSGQRFAA